MPQTIYPLDSLTVDKIAAGEVIESPASCVKELIDNAIDAGATSLLIEIQLGGRELILIKDDGKGMCKEDLQLSCERHATSKIRTIEDLESLTSRGFRGEALSSIAAISKMSLRTKEKILSDPSPVGKGSELIIEGGKILNLSEIMAPVGTQVIVQSLFYNVPARRKFLKPPSKNALEVLKTVKQLALISPGISFTLISDKKTVFQVDATDSLQERVKAVLKEPYSSSSLPLYFQKTGLTIEGQLVLPEQAKKNRSGQYIFVNGRPITSFMLSATMKAVYSTSLKSDEYPQFVLSLHIDPDRVDMNVHPQKKEVRFADEEWIKAELYEAVSYALFAIQRRPFENESLPAPFQKCIDCSFESNTSDSHQFLLSPIKKKNFFPVPSFFEEFMEVPISKEEKEPTTFKHHFQVGPFSIVTLGNNRAVLINLVQALLATVSTIVKKSTSKYSSQLLLQPEIIELGPLERDCLDGKLASFQTMGFSLSQFGINSLLLESIPSFLDTKMAVACVRELIDENDLEEELPSKKIQSQLLKACMHSYPELSEEKIDPSSAIKIIDNWIKAGSPACTLSGKKVSVPLEKKSLETLFEKFL
jgi:DNA mismatch repair protein MutL